MRQEVLINYFYNKAFRLNQPVSVVIELTTLCNLRCEHCYIPSFTNRGMSFEQVKKLLLELRELGVVNVTITGGEILLRKDLFEIIKFARSLYMRVFLLSNGTLLTEAIVEKLASLYVSEFSTTIFSMNSDIHDSITGSEGSLNHLLKNLNFFKKTNIQVRVKTPLMKKNLSDFLDVKKYAEEHGFDFAVSPLIFSKSDGNETPKELRIKDSELISAIKDIDSITRNNHLTEQEVSCAALFYSFAIDCNGYVYPCNSFFYKVGNVFEKNVKEIWYESKELNKIKSIKKADLQVCKGCKYSKHCDRCPALVFMDGLSLNSCDRYSKKLAKIRDSDYTKI